MSNELPELKVRVWLEQDGETLFGQGMMALLALIEEKGSLNQAAKTLRMSYRAAWGKLKKTEERLGQKLVHKSSDRGRRFVLTPYGKMLMDNFDVLKKDIQKYAMARATKIIGDTIHQNSNIITQ